MKVTLKILSIILVLLIVVFFAYFNNTSFVNTKTVSFYNNLKDSLKAKGYSDRLLVVSTKRLKWHNKVQVKYSGAASRSRHLGGDAIDFLVFDVNKDGNSDNQDVDIVYDILDKLIIKNEGGIGTYKNENSFIDKQMIHIDSREVRARWHR